MKAEDYYNEFISKYGIEIDGMPSLTKNEVLALMEGYHVEKSKPKKETTDDSYSLGGGYIGEALMTCKKRK